jgi:hypothetical protein
MRDPILPLLLEVIAMIAKFSIIIKYFFTINTRSHFNFRDPANEQRDEPQSVGGGNCIRRDYNDTKFTPNFKDSLPYPNDSDLSRHED